MQATSQQPAASIIQEKRDEKGEEKAIRRARAPRALHPSEHPGFTLMHISAALYINEPFYCAIMRQMKKIVTREVKTACCGYDAPSGTFYLAFNPDFMLSLVDPKHPQPEAQLFFVLVHEIFHFVWMHVVERRKSQAQLWNIAADLTINSTLAASKYVVPQCALMPGKRPDFGETGAKADDPKTAEAIEKVAAMFESFPPRQLADYYYYRLLQEWPEELKSYVPGPMDDHSEWGEGGEGTEPDGSFGGADRERLEAQAKKIIASAVREADSSSSGWGTVPQDLKEDIRDMVSDSVPWRDVLKNFVGTLIRAGRSSSIRRINRKFPYIHPGLKRGHMPRLLIAIDQSGSMSDESISTLFGEIHSLSKKVEVGVIAFDCSVVESSFEVVRKGQAPTRVRSATGGTDFNSITDWVNSPEQRGKWDGMLIMTDGCAAAPHDSRVRRGWITIPGTQMAFNTGDELVISMSPDRDRAAQRNV